MQAVLMAIAHVVEQVGGARQQAERDDRGRDVAADRRDRDHSRCARRGQQQHVLAPLARTACAQQDAREPRPRRVHGGGRRLRFARNPRLLLGLEDLK